MQENLQGVNIVEFVTPFDNRPQRWEADVLVPTMNDAKNPGLPFFLKRQYGGLQFCQGIRFWS
jgi:hypothetical protein